MIIEMKAGANPIEIEAVILRVRDLGFEVQMNIGTERKVIAVLGAKYRRVGYRIF